MSTPLTDADLADIQTRCDEAEDGWHLIEDPDDVYRLEIHGDGPTLVAVFGGDPDNGSASYPTRENALFAVHARWDVPALLAEVRRLRAQHVRAVEMIEASPEAFLAPASQNMGAALTLLRDGDAR